MANERLALCAIRSLTLPNRPGGPLSPFWSMDLMREISEIRGDGRNLGGGTLSRITERFEAEEWLEGSWETETFDDGRRSKPRRYWRVTLAGKAKARAAWSEATTSPVGATHQPVLKPAGTV